MSVAHQQTNGDDTPDQRAGSLSDRDKEILAFERKWYRYAGAKEEAIRSKFDLSAASYFQILNSLLDSPAALAQDPMLVKRLRRMRFARQGERTARRQTR